MINNNGRTCLWNVVTKTYEEDARLSVVKYLIETRGMDFQSPDNDGLPLHNYDIKDSNFDNHNQKMFRYLNSKVQSCPDYFMC